MQVTLCRNRILAVATRGETIDSSKTNSAYRKRSRLHPTYLGPFDGSATAYSVSDGVVPDISESFFLSRTLNTTLQTPNAAHGPNDRLKGMYKWFSKYTT